MSVWVPDTVKESVILLVNKSWSHSVFFFFFLSPDSRQYAFEKQTIPLSQDNSPKVKVACDPISLIWRVALHMDRLKGGQGKVRGGTEKAYNEEDLGGKQHMPRTANYLTEIFNSEKEYGYS